MKAINFTAIEILPELLKGWESNWKYGKAQTIRPCFKEPRLKVGDIVSIYWNQRSPKGSLFCSNCGKLYPFSNNCLRYKPFPKYLGKVKITEVFIIHIEKDDSEFYVRFFTRYRKKSLYHKHDIEVKRLAKRDGFKTPKDMFNWFDMHYNLKQQYRFAVYRWKGFNHG